MTLIYLHLHSRFSDGTYEPEELAAQARRHALAAIALTDHDSVEGCAATARACAAAGIEFIAGTELTAEQDGNELHILGYGFDTRNARLLTQIAKFQAVRQNATRRRATTSDATAQDSGRLCAPPARSPETEHRAGTS